MNSIWHSIDPSRVTEERFICCIEIPKGSKKKYELDKETGMLILNRMLFTSTHYPENYGFIPLTYAEDDDPLDVLVICQESLDPLVLVEAFPIGVIKMVDDDQVDEKIIAVAVNDPTKNVYKDISDLPSHIFTEISHFFEVYKTLEGKKTIIYETLGVESAKESIRKALQSYKEKFLNKA